jgi:excisionase family DNA binding protein
VLTVADVANRLGVSEQTVLRLITAGDLGAHKVGKQYRIALEALADYLERTRVVTK